MAFEVQGSGAVAVTPHHLATEAALQVYESGGNAVEAMVAANAVQGVVAPDTCGVGGDLFALVWRPGDTSPACLNSSGPAGSNADPEELRREGHRVVPPTHPLSVTVPGCVAGWQALVERHCRLPLGALLEPAIRLAEDGFPASFGLVEAFTERQDELAHQPSPGEMYPGGRPPAPGDLIRRPLLAATLRSIAGEGWRAFYEGSPAEEISEAVGGRITAEDLAGFRPEWVQPASLDVYGTTGWTTPPNSQGYLTLATSRVFELTSPPDDPDDPTWTHLLVEAYRSVAWERDERLADPRRSPVALDQLLADHLLEERARRVRRDRAGTWPDVSPAPPGTAFMCGMDAAGMAVSLIQSNFAGIGSSLGAGRAGFVLHNRGSGFDLRPGHPNELAPGKRPLHTLSPSLWTRDGRLVGLLGTRGGNQQPQILAQMAARLFLAGQRPGEAQEGHRWTLDQIGGGAPSILRIEGGASPRLVEELEIRGHRVRSSPGREPGWGPVSVVLVDEGDVRTAAADPRVDTASAAMAGT